MAQDITNHSSVPAKTTLQHDYILVDGSGSMQSKWWDSLDAIDAYLGATKELGLQSHVTVSVFSGQDLDMVQRDTPLSSYVTMREAPIGSTWAGTPLYDAINVMARRLRDLDPPRCSIVIVTDGHENTSQFTDQVQAKAILDWCRAKGWQVTFIGADFNNAQQASLLGANPASAIGVQKKLLKDAGRELGKKRAHYGLYGTQMHFTEEERTQFGGLLADNTKKGDE